MPGEKQLCLRIDGCPDDFVIGGIWSVGSGNAGENLEKAAREENAKVYRNLYSGVCVLGNPAPGCYGLFKKVPAKARSLAAAVARAMKEDDRFRIFLYHLKDSAGAEVVWMLMVDRGVVQVDGDTLMSYQEWDDFYRNPPEEYGEAEIEDIPFQKALSALSEIWSGLDKPDRSLTRIAGFEDRKRRNRNLAAAGAGVFILLSGCLWWWLDAREERLLLEQKQRLEEEASRRISALKKSEFRPVWLDAPTPQAVFSEVAELAASTPLSIDGWILVSLKVSGGECRSLYERDPAGPWLPPPGAPVPRNPLQSIVSRPFLPGSFERSGGIMRKADAEKWLSGLAFGKPFRISWKLFPEEWKTIRIGRRQVELKSAWQKFSLSLTNVPLMRGVGELLDAPGLMIDSVSFEENEWKVDATLHVLP